MIWAHFGPVTLFCFLFFFSFCLCPSLRLAVPPLSHALLTVPLMSCPEAWTDCSERPRNLASFVLVTKAQLTSLLLSPWIHLTSDTWMEVRSSPPGFLPSASLAWQQLTLGKRFLSMCYHPCCASGVRCVALVQKLGWVGEHSTASPQAGTTGQAHQENVRNNQRYPQIRDLSTCLHFCRL